MFGIDSAELLVVALVALVVIGPKDLPNLMRSVGYWVGRARGMARHFRSGIDTMIREAELEEMEKNWREENERIMREQPMIPPDHAPLASPDELAEDSGTGAAAPSDAPAAAPAPSDAPAAVQAPSDAPPPPHRDGEALP